MRETQKRAWRNVRKNESTRIPRKHIFIHATPAITRQAQASVRTWSEGVAYFVTTRKGRPPVEVSRQFTKVSDIWDAVSVFASQEGRVIVWMHNVGYVARLTDALSSLLSRGFTLTAHNISNRSTWLEWRRDKTTLIIADVTSIFPTVIAKLGAWFGMGRLYSDVDTDDSGIRMERCRRDTEIIKVSVLEYLRWLEDDDCGNWQVTGAGQSWALFRHKFLTHKMTTHDDINALAAERRAMWSGRCEAYWKGELTFQTVHEWDFSNSYPRIARDYPVPVLLLGPMPLSFDWQTAIRADKVGVLAEVIVRTELPVVPTEREGRTLWPVGEFRTTLWSPEIVAALDAGAEVMVERAWLYRLRPALRAWGEWILGELAKPDSEVPTWRKSVLKHHSRALIGRMSMTYNSWELYATAPFSNVSRETVIDLSSGDTYQLMQVGTEVWQDVGRVEWPHSMPMVTGWIQSVARVELWNLLQSLPERVALYADTDSILVTQNHLECVDEIARSAFNSRLRLKRSWDGIAIYGPRQVVTGNQVRVSGVPTSASRVDKRIYSGAIYDSLGTSIRGGSTSSITVRDRQWRITGVDHRRVGNPPGWTSPHTVRLDD